MSKERIKNPDRDDPFAEEVTAKGEGRKRGKVSSTLSFPPTPSTLPSLPLPSTISPRMAYNQIGSASPSSNRSEDIPLLPRSHAHPTFPYFSQAQQPQPHAPPRSSLKPALTLDTSSPHPDFPPTRIPLPTNPAAAARLDHLRDSVDSIRSPQSRELLTSSPIQTTFSSAGEQTNALAGWTGADVFFEHLGKIRALGAEVGSLHAEMEGVGVGWEPGKTEAEQEGSEKGKTKEKEESKDFDAAAAMFEKRQNSVEGIMSKVRSSSRLLPPFLPSPSPSSLSSLPIPDLISCPCVSQLADLSSSLQTFHDLKDPKLGFPRGGIDSTPPSRAGSQSHKPGSSSISNNLPHKRSTLRNGETFFGGGRGEAGREDGKGTTGLGIH